MATYKEIVYMVFDLAKNFSDDSIWEEDHILFLMDKYRAALLKQKYSNQRSEPSITNYQILCIDLCQTESLTSVDGYLKSVKKIPSAIMMSRLSDSISVSGFDIMNSQFQVVDSNRFQFVGKNPRLRRWSYATIGPDNFLYIKSIQPDTSALKQVKIVGLFHNPAKASLLECCKSDTDILDQEYPLEEELVPPMIDMILQTILGASYRPEDKVNNANDDLSNIQTK